MARIEIETLSSRPTRPIGADAESRAWYVGEALVRVDEHVGAVAASGSPLSSFGAIRAERARDEHVDVDAR